MAFMTFHYIGNVIIPTDFHIFWRGRYTTNQINIDPRKMYSFKHLYASMRSKMCLAIIFPCQESPYEGGRFQLKILCSASYPYAAPQAVGWSIWRPLVEIMG